MAGVNAAAPALSSIEDAQARVARMAGILPLPMLFVSVLLAALLTAGGYGSWGRFDLGLFGVAAATACSLVALLRRRDDRPWVVAALCGGQTLVAAYLVWTNPWYGIFAWVGILQARRLPRPWRWVGIAATALVLALSQVGGSLSADALSIGAYLVVAALNAVLAFALTRLTERVGEQNAERGRIIADLAEANRRLEDAMSENAGLHAQLVAQAREAGALDERRRLAGEIHDTLAQALTGIVTQLEAARRTDGLPTAVAHHMGQAQELARAGLTEARRSVQALRPEQLEDASLADALSALASDWSQHTGVTASVETDGAPARLGTDIDSAVFRVAQEALTNVGKHAGAAHVWITLTYLDDLLLLDVRDDGRGFDATVPVTRTGGEGLGLEGMRQRLGRVQGTLAVESTPGDGTALSASIPLRDAP